MPRVIRVSFDAGRRSQQVVSKGSIPIVMGTTASSVSASVRWILLFLLLLPMVSHVTGIQWLALAKSKYSWNQSHHCLQARKNHGLQGRQIKLCKRHLDIMMHVVTASQRTVSTCQETFADRRWNCSSINFAPNFAHDLTSGTREQAFVYALSAAAVAHTTARACSAGSLLSCGCGQVPHEPPHGNFKWGGCADNVRFGIKFARTFADAPWKRKAIRRSTEAIMSRHNNKAGRQAVQFSLQTQCKCHGISGSCNIKTCWRALPKLREVGERLRRKYYVATEVVPHQVGSRKKLLPANNQLGMYHKDDLIFYTKSPDYCLPDERVGSLGTHGRSCNATSQGTDGCDSMCCGRGYRTFTVEKLERCHCKYYWCCYVKCKTCRTWVDVHECL